MGRTAVLLLAAAVLACRPAPRVPPGVPPAPDPFHRAPYLQAVHADSATVMWREDPAGDGELLFRVAGGAWKAAAVEAGERGNRRAVLSGLPSGAEVEFRAVSRGREMGPYRFRAAPSDTSTAAVEVLAFGDSGWGSDAQILLAEEMKRRDWDLAVHVGDIAYPDGTEEDFTVRHFRVYRPLFAGVPFYPAPGNHDIRSDGGAPYDRAFRWPDGRPGGRYYSFRWGRVQFLALDTSTDREVEALKGRRGDQYRWLASTLDSVARDTTLAWTVVFTHEPLYSHGSGLGGHGADPGLRKALEPLFLHHGVDLVLMGHEHHYERTRPLRRGRPVEAGCGPVYFVTGGGGASRFGRAVSPGPRAARVSREHHFLGLKVEPHAATGEAVGADGRRLDRFRILPYDPGADEDRCDG